MKRKKIIKWVSILFVVGIITGGSIFAYYWFMPPRDTQATPIDYNLTADALVQEYLSSPDQANNKYLTEDGDSKVLGVSGVVSSISDDMEGNKVVLLKEEGKDLGVICYFLKAAKVNAEKLKVGEKTTIKGVIRSGAEYDEDLDLFEDAVMQDCDVI
jgi:hypothetical protein